LLPAEQSAEVPDEHQDDGMLPPVVTQPAALTAPIHELDSR
jgi:hypothetical protein